MWTADDPMPKTPATLATLTTAPLGLAQRRGAGADRLERGDRVEPVDVDKVLDVERIAILVRADPCAAARHDGDGTSQGIAHACALGRADARACHAFRCVISSGTAMPTNFAKSIVVSRTMSAIV